MALALKKKADVDDLAVLVDDIRALRRDLTALAGRARPSLLSMWNASDVSDRFGDRASALYRDATRQGAKTYRALNRQFRDQPAASVVVAFAVGLLVSRLLRTRD
jgi:hypothetical protein